MKLRCLMQSCLYVLYGSYSVYKYYINWYFLYIQGGTNFRIGSMAVLMSENMVYITNPTNGTILKHSIPPLISTSEIEGRKTTTTTSDQNSRIKRADTPQGNGMQSILVR